MPANLIQVAPDKEGRPGLVLLELEAEEKESSEKKKPTT